MELTGIATDMYAISQNLTQEQKEKLGDILAQYDPEIFAGNQLQSLRNDISDAGISLNSQAMRMIREAGFDLRGQKQEASTENADNDLKSQKTELWDLFKQFQMGEITEAEFKSAVGEMQVGMLFNISL